MKIARSVLTILLLLFVAVTVGTLIAQETSRPEPQPTNSSDTGSVATSVEGTASDTVENTPPDVSLADEPGIVGVTPTNVDDVSSEHEPVDATPSLQDAPPCVIEAIYFHNTHRCYTCLKIENDARAIVEEAYADEFAAGTLTWSAVNMEEQRSAIEEYNLTSPSLVLVRRVADEVVDWVLLDETWSLVRSTTRYSAYILDSFERFLGGCNE